MTIRWRQGGKVPLHVYRQRGDEPDRRPYPDGDPPIAMFLTPEDAELACRAVNALAVTEDNRELRVVPVSPEVDSALAARIRRFTRLRLHWMDE